MEDQSPENGKEGKREEKYIAQERQGKTKRRRRKEKKGNSCASGGVT